MCIRLQKCWNFQLYLNFFKNNFKLCTHFLFNINIISNKPSPRWIYFQLVSQVDLFTFLLEIGQTITICAWLKQCKNRLQSATKKKGCIDRTRHRCMLFLAWVLDGSLKNKLKPNKLINWLISQQMLLWIIILRLMNMCCATKQFSATKISNRKIKVYLLSDGFVY